MQVKCVKNTVIYYDNSVGTLKITIGELYKVYNSFARGGSIYYEIFDDNNYPSTYSGSFFKTMEECRGETIDSVLE